MGGAELTFNESLDVFTELARADGSIGWVVMAGSTAACYFGSWPPASFSAVMFAGSVPLVAGQFAPNGTAVPSPDGYHITGNYSFGSGLQHADWAGCGSFSAPADAGHRRSNRSGQDEAANDRQVNLADDARFQYDLAEAESLFRAGDLWIRTASAKAEQSALNDNIDQAAIGEALQATAWFTQQSTEALQTLYRHIGTTALRDGGFQRCFRDIHATVNTPWSAPRTPTLSPSR